MTKTTSSPETKKPTNTATTTIKTINPATGKTIKEYSIMTKDEIEHKIKKTTSTLQEWKKDIDRRSECLHYFAIELKKNKEELAKLVTTEIGKTIKEARSEVEKCAWAVDYFADNAKSSFQNKLLTLMQERASYHLNQLE